MYIFTEIYALCIPEIKRAMFWPNRDTFNGWHDYLAISLPSTVMLLAEGWAFNVMGVLAGLISVTDQATNTIMLMIIAIMFMVPMGIQSAAAAIIGEQIGANRVSLAKAYFKVMALACLILLVFVQLLVYTFNEQICRVFTTDDDVYELAISTTIIVVLMFTPDMIQGSMQGVIRALDVQKTASYIALASYYLVSLPVACFLVFYQGFGVAGLWIAMAVGVTLQAIFYTRLVFKTDWQQVADCAEERIAKEQDNLM